MATNFNIAFIRWDLLMARYWPFHFQSLSLLHEILFTTGSLKFVWLLSVHLPVYDMLTTS